MSKFVFLFLGIAVFLSGCIYDVSSLKNPSSKTVENNNQRIGMTVEEARRLYNAQVQQRTLDNPFDNEQVPISKNQPKSETSSSGVKAIQKSRTTAYQGTRIIQKNKSSPQGNLKCGSQPSTCGQMTSCSQAMAALKCGNRKLDRDGDGIPCESICGG